MKLRALLVALLAIALVGCSGEEPEPFYPPDPEPTLAITAFDPELEPSAGVLPLVPGDATRLAVTDFDQLRLTLGFGALDGSSPAQERQRFWRRVARSTALTQGMLLPHDERLREDFSVGADDVAWEAEYAGGGTAGWVIAFHADVPTRRIRRAIRAGVGPLEDAVLDSEHNVVTSAEVPEIAASWAQHQQLVDIAGREANATWIERGCVPLEEMYGEGIVGQLEGQTSRDVDDLQELDAYAVALGTELVTVLLGGARKDAFIRMRLAGHLPQLDPEFGRVFDGGVASPADGILGYRVVKPQRVARWVDERRLPFAACAP